VVSWSGQQNAPLPGNGATSGTEEAVPAAAVGAAQHERDEKVFDGLKRAAADLQARRNARTEQVDGVRRYAYQHRKDLLVRLKTSLGEVRVFPAAIVRLERGQPFELRPIVDVSAHVKQADGRHAATGGVRVVVDGPGFQWRLTLPGAHQQLVGVAQQFAAAVTTAGRSSDTAGASVVHGDGDQGRGAVVRADPWQLA
jgi:hypothetical protein